MPETLEVAKVLNLVLDILVFSFVGLGLIYAGILVYRKITGKETV